jgi:ferric-dicitrate binding protein FerR (iron transport regulator)
VVVPSPKSESAVNDGAAQLASFTGRTARLRQVAGVAETRSDEDIDWTNLPSDAIVRVDQRVRCGGGSRVVLALGGGLELRMNEDTEIVPVRTPQPGSPYWVIQLVKGEMFARIPKGPFGLKVMTAGNVATARDGEFIVKTNDLFETRLLIAKGSVSVENDQGRAQGDEGTQIASRMGVAPDPAAPTPDLQKEFHWAYAPILRDEHQTQRPG